MQLFIICIARFCICVCYAVLPIMVIYKCFVSIFKGAWGAGAGRTPKPGVRGSCALRAPLGLQVRYDLSKARCLLPKKYGAPATYLHLQWGY